ncbi:MAG: glycosyltransferase [Planctomycetes bacterium]|nr:glycosyltransferase [Planctomycetota bacterium]
MRICDLTTLYIDGAESGVNTYLHEKARFLARRREGARHVAIVPGRANSRERLFDTTVYTLKSVRAPGKPDHRILTDFSRIREILRAESPDIVETDCVYYLGRVARGALPDVPLVGFYHVHLPTFIARPSVLRFGKSAAAAIERMAWRYVRFCTRPLDRVLVSSRDIESRLVREGFNRIDYVPLGVNLDLFRSRANGNGNHGNGRHAGDPVVILHVGRLSPEKNQRDLIDAFRILSRRGDYRLQIVGDGPARGDLESRAAGDDRIAFLGTRPYAQDMPRLYASADLLAQPSPNETFSLTILEAIASGLPVVAVGQGGPVDLVTPERGELARPGDPHDLAAKIEKVASRRSLCFSSRVHVPARSWDETFDRLLAVYDSVLAARRGSVRRPGGVRAAGRTSRPEPVSAGRA